MGGPGIHRHKLAGYKYLDMPCGSRPGGDCVCTEAAENLLRATGDPGPGGVSGWVWEEARPPEASVLVCQGTGMALTVADFVEQSLRGSTRTGLYCRA